MGEPRVPNISGRLRVAAITDGQSDYGPTATHRRALEIAKEEFATLAPQIRRAIEDYRKKNGLVEEAKASAEATTG